MDMKSKITVIGAGAWGTTLAILLSEKGHQISLWTYEKELATAINTNRENKAFLPGIPLPINIEATNNFDNLPACDFIFYVVPSQFLRSVASASQKYLNPQTVIVCASKGIEEHSLQLPLEILSHELKTHKLAALSGPNLSKEIARGLPAATVVAATDSVVAKAVQNSLILDRFRVYTSTDPLGVQLGGAMKNIIAIAAGIADGLELGNNAKSALLIRGMAEISRLGKAMGAQAATFAGLSGMGDLITTCSSQLSRNHCVGEQIAKGKKLTEILAGTREVAEGVPTTKAALALGEKNKVELPITSAIYAVLYQDKSPYKAISELMGRLAKSE